MCGIYSGLPSISSNKRINSHSCKSNWTNIVKHVFCGTENIYFSDILRLVQWIIPYFLWLQNICIFTADRPYRGHWKGGGNFFKIRRHRNSENVRSKKRVYLKLPQPTLLSSVNRSYHFTSQTYDVSFHHKLMWTVNVGTASR